MRVATVRIRTGSNSGGTLTRQANSPYRTPAPPVSPPSVPSNYAPSYIAMQRQISQQQAAAAAAAGHHGNISTADRKSGYAPVGNIQVAQVCTLIVSEQSHEKFILRAKIGKVQFAVN